MKKLFFIVLISIIGVSAFGQIDSLTAAQATSHKKVREKLNEAINQVNINKIDIDTLNTNAVDTVYAYDYLVRKHPLSRIVTSSDTLELADDGKYLYIDNGSANNLSIPTDAMVSFPLQTTINVILIDVGVTTIVPIGSATIISPGSLTDISSLGDATLVKVAANTWKLIGKLE